MKKILLLVVTIYTLIAPVTYHPDTKLVLYYATLGNEKFWNIYKYLNENVNNAPKFHYPPMNYWLVKAELPVVKLVGGSEIVNWLGVGSNVAFLDKNIFLYNLASKLPILIVILLTGYVIYKISKKMQFSENRSRFAALIWYLNPITIYSGVMMGQNDILAIFPFVLGLYFYFNFPILAFVLFGLGGSIKSFPLIWAIALAGVYPTKSWFKKIYLAIIPLLFYFFTIFPFLKYDYFVNDVLNSGLAMRMFETNINVFGAKLLVVPILLIVVTLIGIKNNLGNNFIGLCTLLVSVNFILLGFSNFNPQWFMWFMPFFSIILAIYGGWWVLLFTLISLFGLTILMDDGFLYWGITSPINSSLINLPYMSDILTNHGFNISLAIRFFRYVLELISFYWLLKCAKFNG